MKRNYTTPTAEKIEFRYQEQVLASNCVSRWVNQGTNNCADGNSHMEYLQ